MKFKLMNEHLSSEMLNLIESKALTPQEKQELKLFIDKNPNATYDDIKDKANGMAMNSKTMTPEEKKNQVLNASYESEKESKIDGINFDNISEIIVVGDARTFDINNNIDEDMDSHSQEFYRNIPDFELKNLDISEIQSIDDLFVIDKLYHLCPEKLSDEQKDKLKDNYRNTTFKVSKSDVENLLTKIKNANNIEIFRTNKNKDFDKKYNMSNEDKLNILKSLSINDYVKSMNSSMGDYFGDLLFVFIVSMEELPDIKIYIKVNQDNTYGDTVLVISFHEAEKNN